MTELEHCPLCGGGMSIVLCGDNTYQYWLITRGRNENRCTCRLFMESDKFPADYDDDYKERYKQRLVEEWNKRL